MRYTPEEYLAMERASETKHEYFDGQIYAMAGASLAHNRISFNLINSLGNGPKGGPCSGMGSDMRVKVSATGLYTYPDAVVVCGEVKLEDAFNDTLLNPTVVFEILSPSTERYDRGDKFINYQRVGSLTDYLLISQDRQRIEHFARTEGGHWLLSHCDAPDREIEVASISCVLRLADIYLGVTIDAGELREPSTESR